MKSQITLIAWLLTNSFLTVNSKVIRALQRPDEFSSRIIGGDVAEPRRFIYAEVSLQDSGGHNCGGSVIASDVVITAAHCENFFDRAFVGLYDLSNITADVEEFGIQKKYVHDSYDETTSTFDLLLIKLDGHITVVDPVRVNGNTRLPRVTDVLSVVGWGATSVKENVASYPVILNEVDLSYVPNGICKQIQDEDGSSLGVWLSDDMMCATDEGKDSCYGDSGGPLLKLGSNPSEDVIVGIVSWGLDCAGKVPGVYQRTSQSWNWIQKTMCEISDSPPEYFGCNTPSPTISPTIMPTAVLTSSPTLQQLSRQSVRTTSSRADPRHVGYAFALLALIPALLMF